MAPRSSTTASAVRNTFRETGTLLPTVDMMAMAKAISVAIGMPHPAAYCVPWLNSR